MIDQFRNAFAAAVNNQPADDKAAARQAAVDAAFAAVVDAVAADDNDQWAAAVRAHAADPAWKAQAFKVDRFAAHRAPWIAIQAAAIQVAIQAADRIADNDPDPAIRDHAAARAADWRNRNRHVDPNVIAHAKAWWIDNQNNA